MNPTPTQPDKQPSERAMKWTRDTMQMINALTPNIKEKAFDPGWFALRQHLEQAASIIDRHTDSMAEELAEALREAEVVLQVVYENAMKAEFFKTAKAMMGPLTKMRTTLAKFDAMKGNR
jgi:hypothetical protein